MSQTPELSASSPNAAGPWQGPEVVESRGVEPLADRPPETGATDPSTSGGAEGQGRGQDASLPLVTEDLLRQVESESRLDPACRWSAIKLAMVEKIRLQNTMLDAMLPALEERIARLESKFDFRLHLLRQRKWSEQTFGPGDRTMGVLDHIRKELHEVFAALTVGEPTLPEWIDVVILALDGAWRSGATPEQIIAALVAKQAKNEARTWPDWRTASPDRAIEHLEGGAA